MEILKNNNGFSLLDKNVQFDFCTNHTICCIDGLCKIKVTGDIPVPELKKDDRLLLPVDEGIAIKVGKKYKKGELDIDNIGGGFCSREGTVSMIIIERNNKFLLISLDSGLNASYYAKREDGQYNLYISCDTEHEVVYGIFPSLAEACFAYKKIKNINPKTLSQKLEKLPEISKLIGGGIFWMWNDNYNEVMYADYDTDLSPAVGDDILQVAEYLHSNDVEKAMFGIFFDEDSVYTKDLYSKYGYLSTQYDNYNDVLNPELLDLIPKNRYKNCGYTKRRTIDYPNGIMLDKDKNMALAWELMGLDKKYHPQNMLCPSVAAKRMREEIPQIIEKYPYYKGRFIDVYGGFLAECFSEQHPLSLKECLNVKKQAFDFLGEIGLIAGTEDGFEDLADNIVYAEGLHSPIYFRIENAGRNHAKIYDDEQCKHIKTNMLDPECRVPIWQLLYHDCVISFPYWGDSTESSIELINQKVLYACLFGCPPLYSFSMKDFNKIKKDIVESYKKISKVFEKVALLPMTGYDVLTDDYQIQRTVFGDKYEIVVNFSKKDYDYKGTVVRSQDFIMREVV